mmetsp:Transcript_1993/g.4630  ORF Transcript_1993/g.4630 Transcript_1993/m.4630 type:complete len:201 (+) Transcript_1993:2402-3004(+)
MKSTARSRTDSKCSSISSSSVFCAATNSGMMVSSVTVSSARYGNGSKVNSGVGSGSVSGVGSDPSSFPSSAGAASASGASPSSTAGGSDGGGGGWYISLKIPVHTVNRFPRAVNIKSGCLNASASFTTHCSSVSPSFSSSPSPSPSPSFPSPPPPASPLVGDASASTAAASSAAGTAAGALHLARGATLGTIRNTRHSLR